MATSPAYVTAPVKSATLSKTNIIGLLLALFGVAGLLGWLPEGFDASTFVNSVVSAGGLLVILFRTFSTEILKPAVSKNTG